MEPQRVFECYISVLARLCVGARQPNTGAREYSKIASDINSILEKIARDHGYNAAMSILYRVAAKTGCSVGPLHFEMAYELVGRGCIFTKAVEAQPARNNHDNGPINIYMI